MSRERELLIPTVEAGLREIIRYAQECMEVADDPRGYYSLREIAEKTLALFLAATAPVPPETPYTFKPVAGQIITGRWEGTTFIPEKERVLGCAHGRGVGVPCPHCLGINARAALPKEE